MADSSTPNVLDSVDDSAGQRGWTAQQGVPLPAPESIPGNVVLEAELPYKESLARTGINPADYLTNVVVAANPNDKAKILREHPAAEKPAPTAVDRAKSPLLEAAPSVEADAQSTADQNAEAGKAAEEAAKGDDLQATGDTAQA